MWAAQAAGYLEKRKKLRADHQRELTHQRDKYEAERYKTAEKMLALKEEMKVGNQSLNKLRATSLEQISRIDMWKAAASARQLEARAAKTSQGIALARAAQAEAQLEKQRGQQLSARQQQQREQARLEELEAARGAVSDLRGEVIQLRETTPPKGRRAAAARAEDAFKEGGATTLVGWQCALINPRIGSTMHFSPREQEFARRIVDECNLSFESYPKAHALFLQKFFGDAVMEDPRVCEALLINNRAAEEAYFALSMRDQETMKAEGMLDDSPVGVGADVGNKDKARDIIALSLWHAAKRKPYTKALACSDLHADQSAANAAATVEAALERDGRRPALTVHMLTDGATAATGESDALLAGQARLATLLTSPPLTSMRTIAAPPSVLLSTETFRETGPLRPALPARATNTTHV